MTYVPPRRCPRGRRIPVLIAVLVVSFGITAVSTAAPRTQTGVPGPAVCEPSGDVVLYARELSRRPAGPIQKVLVEATLYSTRSLRSLRLHGAVVGRGGFDELFGIPDSVGELRRQAVRKVLYELELEDGRDHHLEFALEAEGDHGSRLASSAWVRVNLDDSIEPRRLPGLLQFETKPEVGR